MLRVCFKPYFCSSASFGQIDSESHNHLFLVLFLGLIMKTPLFSLVISFIVYSGSVFAACGTNNTYLKQSQLNTVLGSHYACAKSGGTMANGWNELHNGTSPGSLIEQHEGGATTENVGNWATSTSGGNGRVTYSYSGGSTPVYEVATASTNCNSNPTGCTTLPQTYSFCGVGGGAPATLQVYISATPQTSPWGNCPSN